jgi:hypothetical protein
LAFLHDVVANGKENRGQLRQALNKQGITTRSFLRTAMSQSDSDVVMDAVPERELGYNPDQDPDEKRRVRTHYRKLQAELDGAARSLDSLLLHHV